MHTIYDPDFRPRAYFWPLGLETHLLARIKGTQRRQAVQALIDAGQLDAIPAFLARSGLGEDERRVLGRIHPSFMGGEYLPDMDAHEVEIARISIASVLADVTSVYACLEPDGIRYRVVDEFGGDTLGEERERRSPSPLTLGELTDFFLAAWPFMAVLEMNHGRDLDAMLAFFDGESAFYPGFDHRLRELVVARFGPEGEGGADAWVDE